MPKSDQNRTVNTVFCCVFRGRGVPKNTESASIQCILAGFRQILGAQFGNIRARILCILAQKEENGSLDVQKLARNTLYFGKYWPELVKSIGHTQGVSNR